jgi:predicted nicotinamide N-methyase
MFQFAFGDNLEEKEEAPIQRILGKQVDYQQSTGETHPIMGEVVVLEGMVLYKRALADINFEIAQRDDMVHGNELVQAITQSSDLIAGVYEGGCKTWECSLDLVRFLHSLPDALLNGKRVIELGCGSALPGIYCLKRGATTDFQDYNEDVIQLVTIPNVTLNRISLELDIDEQGLFETEIQYECGQSRFFAGDWSHLAQIIDEKYDIILTSETIYSSQNIPVLLSLIRSILKPGGFVLVAAKHNYFGCTGSMPIFKTFVEDSGFQMETVFEQAKGVRREIVKLY